MTRLNITIPDDLANELRKITNKSRFIAEALRKELDELSQKRLDMILTEGYKKTKDEDNSINKEWEKITLESWM